MAKTIDQLINEHMAARATLNAKLLQMFPVGSTVGFTISCMQVNPSTGVVLGVDRNAGYMRVRHNEAKPRSRYEVRTVHHSRILWCEGKVSAPAPQPERAHGITATPEGKQS